MGDDQASTGHRTGTGLPVEGPQDVPRARHYVSSRLRDGGGEDLLDVAELATTELVTNALLHGRKPIEVRIEHEPGMARIEVVDASPVLPMVGLLGDNEMTGRGLALIDALASRWNAQPVAGGKVVWCELRSSADSSIDADAALAAAFDPDLFASELEDLAELTGPAPVEPEQPPLTAKGDATPVLLPDVPVRLLMAVESHVDDLIRDLTLAGTAPSPGRADTVPATVAARVAAAAEAVAPIRRSLRRQALDGRAAGLDTIAVTVPAEPGVADAAVEYLAALDEADSYCRAARLLTLEAPPQHRVLRRWLLDQVLVATERGVFADSDGTPPVQSFRDRLLQELGTLAVIQRTAARAGRLQRVATGLSEARTPEQVAGVVLEEGTAALGASRAAFLRLENDRLELTGALGMGEPALALAATVSLTRSLPSVDAIRQGEPLWIESLAERDRRYPELASADPASRSLVAAPLVVGGRTLGVLRFGFDADLVVDEDERDFVAAIAAQAASALDRSLTYAAEHRARQQAERTAGRLRRLQEITAALSATLDESEVASVVLGNAAEALGARIGTICLLARPAAPRQLEPDAEVLIAHSVGVAAEASERWGRFSLADPVPASEAIRSNRPVVLSTVADLRRRFPQMVGGMPEDDHALVVMPLSVGDRRLGALTLSFFDERFREQSGLSVDDLAFLSSLADACAQAIDRARAVRALRTASSRLAFLAEASVELASSRELDRTLRRVAELAVPVLADWCTVALVDETPDAPPTLRTLALAHVDPGKTSAAQELERRYPPDPERSGAYRVLRTGRSEIFPRVTDQQVAETATDDEHARLLASIGPLRSVMLVPMTARETVLGVLTLISSAEERTFEPDDLALAEDLARRAALAVETARLLRDAPGT